MLLAAAAFTSLAVWGYLSAAHGSFWRLRGRPRSAHPGETQSSVVAVVPARNEADVVGHAVTSLLQQQSMPSLLVVLVDDGSSDGTAEIARKAAVEAGSPERLIVVEGRPLQPGWTGKLWAMDQGVTTALQFNPKFLLFTDADIEHGPDVCYELVREAEDDHLDLTSRMVNLSTDSLAEQLLIPAFVYFFFQLYPPSWVADRNRTIAGAAGGCLLVRTAALRRIGGLRSVQNALIDDCAIAAAVKGSGGALSLRTTLQSRSLRSYGGFAGVGNMIARSAFYQLRHSPVLLVLTLAGLLLVYVVPPVATLSSRGRTRAAGAAAWSLMSFTYLPVLREYRRPAWQCVTLPLVALFYAGATLYSALQFARGQGGLWKGRAQDVASNADIASRAR